MPRVTIADFTFTPRFAGASDLYPVNREDELEILLAIGAHNAKSADPRFRKPVLAFTTQNYGSGKSFFGTNSPRIMRDDILNNGVVHRRLMGQLLRGEKCHGLIPHKFTSTELNAFADATIITVDMRKLMNDGFRCLLNFSVKQG